MFLRVKSKEIRKLRNFIEFIRLSTIWEISKKLCFVYDHKLLGLLA